MNFYIHVYDRYMTSAEKREGRGGRGVGGGGWSESCFLAILPKTLHVRHVLRLELPELQYRH